MSLIQITPENIRVQAKNIRKYKVDQEKTISKLRQLIYSLDESWKGEAQGAFVAKFQSMDNVYKRFTEVLEQYADLLDKAAKEMETADQNAKTKIRNI